MHAFAMTVETFIALITQKNHQYYKQREIVDPVVYAYPIVYIS